MTGHHSGERPLDPREYERRTQLRLLDERLTELEHSMAQAIKLFGAMNQELAQISERIEYLMNRHPYT